MTVYYSSMVYTMWYLTKSDNMNIIYNFKIYDLSKTCQEFKQVIMWTLSINTVKRNYSQNTSNVFSGE